MTIGTPDRRRRSTVATRCSPSAMNGEPLPVAHGFPVRMVVPGLYGYVVGDEVARRPGADDLRRLRPVLGPARLGTRRRPIKTMSRIDTPRPLATIRRRARSRSPAWRGRSTAASTRVEVRIDDGAVAGRRRLAAVDTIDTWRQWALRLGGRAGPPHVSRSGRPTATESSKTERPARTVPGRSDRLALDRRDGRLTIDRTRSSGSETAGVRHRGTDPDRRPTGATNR